MNRAEVMNRAEKLRAGYLVATQCTFVVKVRPSPHTGLGCCQLSEGHALPHELYPGLERRKHARWHMSPVTWGSPSRRRRPKEATK